MRSAFHCEPWRRRQASDRVVRSRFISIVLRGERRLLIVADAATKSISPPSSRFLLPVVLFTSDGEISTMAPVAAVWCWPQLLTSTLRPGSCRFVVEFRVDGLSLQAILLLHNTHTVHVNAKSAVFWSPASKDYVRHSAELCMCFLNYRQIDC